MGKRYQALVSLAGLLALSTLRVVRAEPVAARLCFPSYDSQWMVADPIEVISEVRAKEPHPDGSVNSPGCD